MWLDRTTTDRCGMLPVVGKVCEKKIVYKKRCHFVSPLLSDNQYGFAEKTARHINLLVWSKNGHKPWTKLSMLELCFFYLRKAFNNVWHKGLLVALLGRRPRGSTDACLFPGCFHANIFMLILLFFSCQLIRFFFRCQFTKNGELSQDLDFSFFLFYFILF